MIRKYPRFIERGVTDLGDFAEFGGEGYDEVQARVERVLAKLKARHKGPSDVVLVVAHGGINFQMVKAAICVPVPRVCILHWGNCTTTLLRFVSGAPRDCAWRISYGSARRNPWATVGWYESTGVDRAEASGSHLESTGVSR